MSSRTAGALRSLYRDIRIGVRTAGLSEFGSQVLAETIGRVHEQQRLLVIEQDLAVVREVRTPEGVEIEPFTGDWAGLSPIMTSRAMARFRKRFDAGRTCLLAHREDRPIGYTWISHSMDPDIEFLPLALPEDAAYLWDLFVIRGERGSGTGSALTSARLAAARSSGFKLGWRAISPDNKPSVRTAEKTGSVRIIGELTYRRALKRVNFSEDLYGERPILRTPDLRTPDRP